MTDDLSKIFEKNAEWKESFHVWKGPVIRNVRELFEFLDQMSQEQFVHHVNDKKNDIAEWVEHVFEHTEIADEIREIGTKDELYYLLKAKIKFVDTPVDLTGGVEDKHLLKEENEGQFDDEEKFNKVKDAYEVRNEEVGNRFEDIADKIKQTLDNELSKEEEEMFEKVETRYEEVRQKLSELRKTGKDCVLATLRMKWFLPKLKLAKASRERADVQAADEILDAVEQEMKDIRERKEVDVKKEVYAMAGIEEEESDI
jgi:hypothetical protein